MLASLLSALSAMVGGADSTPAATAPAPPADAAAPWRERIAQIQSTAKWLIGAFAAVATVLVAGSQTSDLHGLAGRDLGLAITGVALGTLGVLIAIGKLSAVIAPRPVMSTGRLAALEADSSSSFAKLIDESPELLQNQATSVAVLHGDLVKARQDRYDADQSLQAAPGDKQALKAYAAADQRVQELRTVAGQLRPLGAYCEARDVFTRARRWSFGGAALVVGGVALFAYAAAPDDDAPGPALPPTPSRATLELTTAGRAQLAEALGARCPARPAVVVLGRDKNDYDVVVTEPGCSSVRLTVTPAIGSVIAASAVPVPTSTPRATGD